MFESSENKTRTCKIMINFQIQHICCVDLKKSKEQTNKLKQKPFNSI